VSQTVAARGAGAGLFGEAELRRIAQEALRQADGDGAEAVVIARTLELTRFANSAIHQNVSSREAQLQVRVVRGKRIAMLTTSDLGPEGIGRVTRSASDLSRLVPENPEFGGLPDARPISTAPSAFVDRTAATTPLERARLAERVCRPARERSLAAAGYVSTTAQEIAIASTRGVWAYSPETRANAEAVCIGDAGSAWAERSSIDVARVDADGLASEAIAKCIAAQAPRDLDAGTYEVVLEPYAVNDIAAFLGLALTGVAVEEGRSFVGGKLGQRVTGDVTIREDPFDPECVPRPFDFEGQPSRAVTLIEQGVARAVVYDSATAHRTGAENTGHALPPNSFLSCTPMHGRVEAGDQTREELIRGVRRGVLVTRFHYTRWVHQLRTIVTGMTRDGTFAIENGEIADPVKNFRFTQSYHEALAGTLGVGRELHLFAASEFGGVSAIARRVPALRLAAFTFTGTTQY